MLLILITMIILRPLVFFCWFFSFTSTKCGTHGLNIFKSRISQAVALGCSTEACINTWIWERRKWAYEISLSLWSQKSFIRFLFLLIRMHRIKQPKAMEFTEVSSEPFFNHIFLNEGLLHCILFLTLCYKEFYILSAIYSLYFVSDT